MINLYFGIALMLLLCFVEILFIKFREKKEVPWREIVFNLNSGHAVLWVFRGVEVFLFDVVSRHLNLGWIGQLPIWSQWVFAFFAWDFCFYWMHRLHHKYRILWAVHAVHHEGEHFNCSLGIRNSWYSSLTSFPFFAGLAVIGVSTEQFYIMGAVHYFIQFYNHNDIIKHHGVVDHIIVSPSHHKIHHASNIQYRDKNCGGTLTIWDKLFGTYQKEQEGVEMQLGLPSSKHAVDHPITANNFHFAKMLKLQQWFLKDTEKKQISKREEILISIGGFVLFCLLIFYIYQEDKWSDDWMLQLFAMLVLATVAIFGMFENLKWGRVLWLLFGLMMMMFSIIIAQQHILLMFFSSIFILHSLLMVIYSKSLPLNT